MSNQAFRRVVDEIQHAYEDGRWEAAGRLRAMLIKAAADAAGRKDAATLGEIEKLGARLFAIAVSRHDADATTPETAAAWLGAALKDFARPILDSLSAPKVAHDDRSSAEHILFALLNRPSRSNAELASDAGLRPETVCRLLPALRAEGLVVTRKAGQRKITQLTRAGRTRIGEERYRFDMGRTSGDGAYSSHLIADRLLFGESHEAIVPAGVASSFEVLVGHSGGAEEGGADFLSKDAFVKYGEKPRSSAPDIFEQSRNSTNESENNFDILLMYNSRIRHGNGEFRSGRVPR